MSPTNFAMKTIPLQKAIWSLQYVEFSENFNKKDVLTYNMITEKGEFVVWAISGVRIHIRHVKGNWNILL